AVGCARGGPLRPGLQGRGELLAGLYGQLGREDAHRLGAGRRGARGAAGERNRRGQGRGHDEQRCQGREAAPVVPHGDDPRLLAAADFPRKEVTLLRLHEPAGTTTLKARGWTVTVAGKPPITCPSAWIRTELGPSTRTIWAFP